MSDQGEDVKELKYIRWTMFWTQMIVFCIWMNVGPCTQRNEGGIKVKIVQPEPEDHK